MPVNSLIDIYLLFRLSKQRQVHSASPSAAQKESPLVEVGTIVVLSFNFEARQFVIHDLAVD
jgi:hypothetical protein